MPKKVDDKIYLNPAIPKNTRLAQYLEAGSAQSGITKSQILVWFASEYVRIVLDGGKADLPVAPVTTIPAAPTPAPASEEQDERPQGSIRTLPNAAIDDDANYDAFGDPD